LKWLIQALEALKSAMLNLVAMCSAFSHSNVPLITALLPLASLSHVANQLSSS
jgi:hypothetical protein